jgi:hypothetical protein
MAMQIETLPEIHIMINLKFRNTYNLPVMHNLGPQFSHSKHTNGTNTINRNKDSQQQKKTPRPFKLRRLVPKGKMKMGSTEFFQLNHQKRLDSMDWLTNQTKHLPKVVRLGTEPNCTPDGRPNCFVPGTIVHAPPTEKTYTVKNKEGIKVKKTKILKPRAYIHASKGLDIWPAPEYCDTDIAVAVYDPKDYRYGKILLLSIYWHSLEDDLPQKYWDAIKYAEDNDYTVVSGGDFNAKTRLWNADKTNKQGELIEQHMIDANLAPITDDLGVNTSNTGRGGNVIDATLASSSIAHLIKGWRVCTGKNEYAYSDHRLIRFRLETLPDEC